MPVEARLPSSQESPSLVGGDLAKEVGHRFECTLCGDCCTGNQVVRLVGGDLDLMARRMGLSRRSELKAHGVVELRRESVGSAGFVWRPRIRFRQRPLVQCPFLSNTVTDEGAYRGLCSLHPEAKPLVCSLSPLAREVSDDGTAASETWSIVAPVEGCPGMGRGAELRPRPPESLQSRLDQEISWMRSWIARSSEALSENEAWALLDEEGGS